MKFASLLFMSFATLTAPALALQPTSLKLGYSVYVGGIKALDVSFVSVESEEDYKYSAEIRSSELVKLFFLWKWSSFSQGKFINGKARPTKAGSNSIWKDKKRRLRVDYNGLFFPEKVQRLPAKDGKGRTPVTRAMKYNTVDPLTAVINLLRASSSSNGCEAVERVFDGIRSYVLGLKKQGSDDLKETRHSSYAGNAFKCQVSIEKLGGYRLRSQSDPRPKREIFAWVAKPFREFQPFLVKLEFETDYGWLIAHLASATLNKAGKLTEIKKKR
jgi:hypothetical protein